MLALVNQLAQDFKDFTFTSGTDFVWSPSEQTIHYDEATISDQKGLWSLLHELGHAQLGHTTYHDDLELLIMEVSAWKQAQQIAQNYEIEIDADHINTCLETYRSWLFHRSKCVECGTHCFQINQTTYQCHNCSTKWQVSASRLCRIRKKRLK